MATRKETRDPQNRGAEDTTGEITDEGIERMRARIGVEIPQLRSFNEYATIDSIRHYAHGYGDDNPLFADPSHGAATRWRAMIAPPGFIVTTGVSEVKEIPPEVRARGAHALAGVHEFFSGDAWEWFHPIYPGDRLTKRKALRVVEVKEASSFTGKRSVFLRYRTDWQNQDGTLITHYWESYIRAEREAAASKGKNRDIRRPEYTREMVQEIEEAYEKEFHRGADTLYWEEVQAGDELPLIVKGGFKAADMLAWVRGFGAGMQAFRLAYLHKKRSPKFYSINEWGYPDTVERVHWDDGWAQRIGNPYAYDFGKMRNAWMCHLITNWIGDDGWLWKMTDELRAFNHFGDTTWVKGKVTGKSVTAEGHHIVEIELACENQRGVISAPGTATVILPSRKNGPVRLPTFSGEKALG